MNNFSFMCRAPSELRRSRLSTTSCPLQNALNNRSIYGDDCRAGIIKLCFLFSLVFYFEFLVTKEDWFSTKILDLTQSQKIFPGRVRANLSPPPKPLTGKPTSVGNAMIRASAALGQPLSFSDHLSTLQCQSSLN